MKVIDTDNILPNCVQHAREIKKIEEQWRKKMRLIDADELPWVDKLVVLDKWDGDIRIEIKDNASYVDEDTPTVEAIPIEFIKRLIEKFDCERGNAIKDTFAHTLTGLLEFWEFEQEERK